MPRRNPLHSRGYNGWGTPEWIIEGARVTMRAIDLDPCSTPEDNLRVGAAEIYTEVDNGLTKPWHGRLLVNPPGNLMVEFWQYLVYEVEMGNTTEALWVGFSLEQLQRLQVSEPDSPHTPAHPLHFPTCFPRKRVRFHRDGQLYRNPTHGNYITYLGPNVRRFREYFSDYGIVR